MKLAAALGASLLLCAAAPALAQSYPGEDVTVNPGALGNGYLLYPGGKYGRHVGALLQPGETGGPIHLHMPGKHPVARHVRPRAPRVAAAPAGPVAVPAEVPAAAPPDTTPPAPRHTARATPPAKPARTASATPPPATPPVTVDPNAMPEDSAGRLFGGAGLSGTPVTPPPAKPARTAGATPPPARATTSPAAAAGLRPQSIIPFAEGSSSPAAADVNAIHAMAATLNAALNGGAARVQLEAYGGPRGDKSSDSRRLSLKRALVVRELLIEDGVPSEKIDVRAMGGADDAGAADRVDVFVRA